MSLAPSTLNDGIFKLWCWVLGRSAPVAKWRLVTQLLGLPRSGGVQEFYQNGIYNVGLLVLLGRIDHVVSNFHRFRKIHRNETDSLPSHREPKRLSRC
jgi:hypothetical protein